MDFKGAIKNGGYDNNGPGGGNFEGYELHDNFELIWMVTIHSYRQRCAIISGHAARLDFLGLNCRTHVGVEVEEGRDER